MDADGNVLAKQRARTVAGFKETLERLSKRAEVEKKAAAGNAEAKVDLLIIDLELGAIDFDKAKEQASGLKMTDAQKAAWNQIGIEAESAAALSAGRGRAATPETAAAVAKTLREMKAAGRIPKGDTALNFWFILANAAVTDGDKKAAEEAYAELDKLAERTPAVRQRALPDLRKKIDALGSGGDKKND